MTGSSGKCPVKKGSLVVTFLIPTTDLFIHVNHLIHQQKGIAVGQPSFYLIDIEQAALGS